MTNGERVALLYYKHKDWLAAVAFNFTKNKERAEDLLQDVYLHLLEMKDLEKIIYSERDLNLFYVYKLIRSKFINSTNKKKRLSTTTLNEDVQEFSQNEEYNYDKDETTEKLLEIVDKALREELHWFDSRLFETYLYDEHSIQSLHEATRISRNTIWVSLNKTKNYIKQKAKDNGLYN
jgi:RNA polymerase sigma-70 factor (ECF subfamily)